MKHPLLAAVTLLALTGCPPADKAADDSGADDTGDPAPCDAAVPGVIVRMDTDAYVGPEDLIWRLGAENGYCLEAGEGEWFCDTNGSGGTVEIEIRVSGHYTVYEAVEVEVGDCAFATLDVTLENMGPFFEEDRAYYIQWIEDEEDCANSWELYEMNCYATAVFCADGDAEVMVTDITYPGIYGVDGSTIAGFYEGAMVEITEDLSFEILSDTEIRDSSYEYTWTLDAEDRFAPYVCREGGA